MSDSFFVHETAVVDDGAGIGAGAKVWHFVHVCAGASVGARAVLGQNVFVGPGAVIGEGCKVQNNVSVYAGVVLEQDVFLGPSAVFTNVLNPRAFVERKDCFLETRIGRGASIGANATVVCGHSIGAYALIGAGAVVTHDVPPHALVLGVPAKHAGWVCVCGERLDGRGGAPLATEPKPYSCHRCQRRYRLSSDQCEPLETTSEA